MNASGTPTGSPPEVTVQNIPVPGAELSAATAGSGPALLLLHGWPHTWQVWSAVLPALAATHTVIAPDLRGLGASTRTDGPFDAGTISADLLALLDHFGADDAALVALDASVPAAFLLAMTRPERIRALVLMESLLMPLPGAEAFLAGGPPWWFGFHSIPGFAERIVAGHEAEYLDWFLTSGTGGRGVEARIRDAFVAAYRGEDALRRGFEYYRAGRENARLVAAATARAVLTVPTMAIGADSVGDALYRQLGPVCPDLVGHVIPDCGHIIPLDRPEALLELIVPFLV